MPLIEAHDLVKTFTRTALLRARSSTTRMLSARQPVVVPACRMARNSLTRSTLAHAPAEGEFERARKVPA